MSELLELCDYWDVSRPTVVKTRGSMACYRPTRKEIRISGSYTGTEEKWVMVHELTHHVDYKINGDIRKGRRSHDKVFFGILVTMIELAYDHITEYPWHKEYRMIYRWACDKGYATRGLGYYGEAVPVKVKQTFYRVRFNADEEIHTVFVEAKTRQEATRQVAAKYPGGYSYTSQRMAS